MATDWDRYPFEYSRLFQVWRNAEREIATIQSSRLQAFIKSWFKEQ